MAVASSFLCPHQNSKFGDNVVICKSEHSVSKMKAQVYLFFAVLSVLSSSSTIYAQFSLKGVVKNQETGQLMEAVNLFIANTSKGTFSNGEGHFLLEDIPFGEQELVISYLGFETKIQRVTYRLAGTYELNVSLNPTTVELTTVNVVSQRDKKWKRYIGRFEKAFFGKTSNAKNMRLLNPDVLVFENKNGTLKASAKDLLHLKNEALGYELFFFLEYFEMKGTAIAYGGKPLFRPVTEGTETDFTRWKTSREKTYRGSTRHFLQALMDNKLRKEGFEMYHARLVNDSDFETLRGMNRSMVLAERGGREFLRINEFLKVIYTKEKDQLKDKESRMGRSMTGLGQKAEKDMIMQEMHQNKSRNPGQVSYLFAKKGNLEINKKGMLKEPQYLLEYGYWANEGVADWLPLEYDPMEKAKEEIVAEKNGFVLTDLLIPIEEIRDGGPPKDGIPAIDRPQFMNAEFAKFIGEKEYVLGVYHNGVAKAYPIKIMDRHEVVNDRIGGEQLVITYCPLCGSGIAFKAQVDGQDYTFGVSGLLYNSDVLLYDRQTQSLWSQIENQAISGPASGEKLQMLPTAFLTWDKWKEQYPNTLILTTETGYRVDYNQKAYLGYEASPKLLFPVAHESRKLRKKERVLGVSINGKHKAYPLRILEKMEQTSFQDTVGGQQLWIRFDSEASAVRITNGAGEQVPAVSLYWFAWYAFHPDTETLEE